MRFFIRDGGALKVMRFRTPEDDERIAAHRESLRTALLAEFEAENLEPLSVEDEFGSKSVSSMTAVHYGNEAKFFVGYAAKEASRRGLHHTVFVKTQTPYRDGDLRCIPFSIIANIPDPISPSTFVSTAVSGEVRVKDHERVTEATIEDFADDALDKLEESIREFLGL